MKTHILVHHHPRYCDGPEPPPWGVLVPLMGTLIEPNGHPDGDGGTIFRLLRDERTFEQPVEAWEDFRGRRTPFRSPGERMHTHVGDVFYARESYGAVMAALGDCVAVPEVTDAD